MNWQQLVLSVLKALAELKKVMLNFHFQRKPWATATKPERPLLTPVRYSVFINLLKAWMNDFPSETFAQVLTVWAT